MVFPLESTAYSAACDWLVNSVNQTRTHRRLAAILVADVVGYSKLMQQDEAGTLARLREKRKTILEPTVAKHHGRIVKLLGDGALIEFGSAVDSVMAAIELQQLFEAGNDGLPEDRRIRLRIGINLGDVIGEGTDIFGDGVNIAARLETLAPAGGLCISEKVHAEIRNRIDANFTDIGQRKLKNIGSPVHAYVLGETVHVMAALADASEAKPSIAVLPLTNMSGESEQEFFADGMTEDIITELSRFKELFVIARNSTFVYKGKAVKIQDVARELGVNYVVEGSVRKAGNRVRITIQLIDAENGQHVWAERYDRQLEDVFAIQDEITTAIVSVLPGRIEAARRERAKNKPTENMLAYECVLAGKVLHHRSERSANVEALKMLDRALALDPKYAHAHAWRACVLGQAWVYGWGDEATIVDEIAAEQVKALALDDQDADVHRTVAALSISMNNLARAQHHQERALALNPNYDLLVVQQGELLTWLGRPEEGIDWIKRAMRLNPFFPQRFWSHLARACFTARQYREAAEALGRLTNPLPEQLAILAAAHAAMDDAASARACAERVMALAPSFSVSQFIATLHYGSEADTAHMKEKLLQAGLPA